MAVFFRVEISKLAILMFCDMHKSCPETFLTSTHLVPQKYSGYSEDWVTLT